MNYILHFINCQDDFLFCKQKIKFYDLSLFIEVNTEVYEILPSGEEKYMGLISRKGIIYICLNLIEYAFKLVKDELSSSSLAFLNQFIENIRKWLEEGFELEFSLTDIYQMSIDNYWIVYMANDCVRIISEQQNDMFCDYYMLGFIEQYKGDMSKDEQNKFILDFLSSGKYLFYL